MNPALLKRNADSGILPRLTAAEEWIAPGLEPKPVAREGYVVSFVSFHKRGLRVPAHEFLRRLLARWEVELHQLTPNGVYILSVFIALCEGWLGIEPNWELFKYFFIAKIQYAVGGNKTPAECGAVMIQPRPKTQRKFIELPKPTNNGPWRSAWFYLKDDPDRPLPVYRGATFDGSSPLWTEKPRVEFKAHILEVEARIARLRAAGVTASVVTAWWVERGIPPLMERRLRLWEITPESDKRGTVVAPERGEVEVQEWVVELTGAPFVYPEGGLLPRPLPSQETRDLVSLFQLASLRFCYVLELICWISCTWFVCAGGRRRDPPFPSAAGNCARRGRARRLCFCCVEQRHLERRRS